MSTRRINPQAVMVVLQRRAQTDPLLALQIENAVLQVALDSPEEPDLDVVFAEETEETEAE